MCSPTRCHTCDISGFRWKFEKLNHRDPCIYDQDSGGKVIGQIHHFPTNFDRSCHRKRAPHGGHRRACSRPPGRACRAAERVDWRPTGPTWGGPTSRCTVTEGSAVDSHGMVSSRSDGGMAAHSTNLRAEIHLGLESQAYASQNVSSLTHSHTR